MGLGRRDLVAEEDFGGLGVEDLEAGGGSEVVEDVGDDAGGLETGCVLEICGIWGNLQ